MAQLTLKPYTPELKDIWDAFVSESKNGTLLHRRDYMGYHSDRFPDASLVAFRDGKPYALLPATFDGRTFSSHAGLTYGGLVTGSKATVAEVLQLMEMIRAHVRSLGASEFIYKPIPAVYHRLPSDEDLYALFRINAVLLARNVSSVISNGSPVRLRDDRKAGMRKALRAGITVEESEDFATFWNILDSNLMSKYGAKPVHTLDEMLRLKSLFPDDIRLHIARKDDKILGGTVIYLSPTVAHTQYISATPEGKSLHALDLLLYTLYNDVYSSRQWFDFGTSNESGGRILNENLISQKEGFGGRAIVYDTYSIPL